jgi:hypothetical protein
MLAEKLDRGLAEAVLIRLRVGLPVTQGVLID